MSSGELTPVQQKAARLLSEGMGVSAVALECEVSRALIWKWNQDKNFRKYIQSFLSEARTIAVGKLGAMTTDALRVVHHVMMDNKELGSTRLNAAFKVIALVLEDRKFDDPVEHENNDTKLPSKKELLKIANEAHKEAYGLSNGGSES